MGFGALEIGRDWGIGNDPSKPTQSEAAGLLELVLRSGVNLIDTAAAYHYSEERIGQSIAHRRTDYFLCSKCGEANKRSTTFS